MSMNGECAGRRFFGLLGLFILNGLEFVKLTGRLKWVRLGVDAGFDHFVGDSHPLMLNFDMIDHVASHQSCDRAVTAAEDFFVASVGLTVKRLTLLFLLLRERSDDRFSAIFESELFLSAFVLVRDAG